MASLWIILAAFLLAARAVPNDLAITADRWYQIGPPVALVEDVAIDSSKSSTLYAATLHGLFKSLDGGERWSPSNAGLPGGNEGTPLSVLSVSVDPIASEAILAGTEQGVFRSADSGGTWTLSSNGMEVPRPTVLGLKRDNVHSAVVYALTLAHPYRSDDGGRSWSKLSRVFSALAVDSGDSRRIFAGGGLGFFSSVDGGQTWSALASPPGETAYDLVLDPRDRRTLFTATPAGVFKSTDAGMSWSYANVKNVKRLAIDPSDGDVVHATDSFSAVLRTTDGGVSWSYTRLPADFNVVSLSVQSPSAALVVDPGDPRIVFASAKGRLQRSLDHGASWSVSDVGISNMFVGSLAGIPGQPGKVLVGSGGILNLDHGILRSEDLGMSWVGSDNGVTSDVFYVLSPDPILPDVVYAAGGGIFRSTDAGLNWAVLEPGIFGSVYGRTGVISSFAVDPTRPATLYAGTVGPWKYQGLSASGIFKSTDAGTTWVRSVTGLPTPQMPSIFSLVVDPSRSDTVYAGTEDGVFKSSDEGATWLRRGLAGFKVNVLRLAPGNPAVLFAGLDQSGIQRSDDGGGNWRSLLPDVSISDLQFDPLDSRNLFAATFGAGISVSCDAGESWASFNEGLADLQMTRLVFDASGSYLFAGGWNLGVSVRQILVNRQPVRGSASHPSARVVGPRDTIEAAARQQ